MYIFTLSAVQLASAAGLIYGMAHVGKSYLNTNPKTAAIVGFASLLFKAMENYFRSQGLPFSSLFTKYQFSILIPVAAGIAAKWLTPFQAISQMAFFSLAALIYYQVTGKSFLMINRTYIDGGYL